MADDTASSTWDSWQFWDLELCYSCVTCKEKIKMFWFERESWCCWGCSKGTARWRLLSQEYVAISAHNWLTGTSGFAKISSINLFSKEPTGNTAFENTGSGATYLASLWCKNVCVCMCVTRERGTILIKQSLLFSELRILFNGLGRVIRDDQMQGSRKGGSLHF